MISGWTSWIHLRYCSGMKDFQGKQQGQFLIVDLQLDWYTWGLLQLSASIFVRSVRGLVALAMDIDNHPLRRDLGSQVSKRDLENLFWFKICYIFDSCSNHNDVNETTGNVLAKWIGSELKEIFRSQEKIRGVNRFIRMDSLEKKHITTWQWSSFGLILTKFLDEMGTC